MCVRVLLRQVFVDMMLLLLNAVDKVCECCQEHLILKKAQERLLKNELQSGLGNELHLENLNYKSNFTRSCIIRNMFELDTRVNINIHVVCFISVCAYICICIVCEVINKNINWSVMFWVLSGGSQSRCIIYIIQCVIYILQISINW